MLAIPFLAAFLRFTPATLRIFTGRVGMAWTGFTAVPGAYAFRAAATGAPLWTIKSAWRLRGWAVEA